MEITRTMISAAELSQRIGIAVPTLQLWRTRRLKGEDIGPKFVKLTKGSGKGGPGVRYMVVHVEKWETKLREQAGHQSESQPSHQFRVGEKSMLSPAELSKRTGIQLQYLSNWRTRRRYGEAIGPRFIHLTENGTDLGPGVRYFIADVEEWERTTGERDMKHPASMVLRQD